MKNTTPKPKNDPNEYKAAARAILIEIAKELRLQGLIR